MNRWRAGLTIALVMTMACAEARTWRRFAAERFGLVVDIPSDWTADPAPDDSAPPSFTSPDRSLRIVISGVLALPAIPDEIKDLERAETGETILHKSSNGRTVTVWGWRGDIGFTRYTLIDCGLAKTLTIEYPAAARGDHANTIAHVMASMKPAHDKEHATCS